MELGNLAESNLAVSKDAAAQAEPVLMPEVMQNGSAENVVHFQFRHGEESQIWAYLQAFQSLQLNVITDVATAQGRILTALPQAEISFQGATELAAAIAEELRFHPELMRCKYFCVNLSAGAKPENAFQHDYECRNEIVRLAMFGEFENKWLTGNFKMQQIPEAITRLKPLMGEADHSMTCQVIILAVSEAQAHAETLLKQEQLSEAQIRKMLTLQARMVAQLMAASMLSMEAQTALISTLQHLRTFGHQLNVYANRGEKTVKDTAHSAYTVLRQEGQMLADHLAHNLGNAALDTKIRQEIRSGLSELKSSGLLGRAKKPENETQFVLKAAAGALASKSKIKLDLASGPIQQRTTPLVEKADISLAKSQVQNRPDLAIGLKPASTTGGAGQILNETKLAATHAASTANATSSAAKQSVSATQTIKQSAPINVADNQKVSAKFSDSRKYQSLQKNEIRKNTGLVVGQKGENLAGGQMPLQQMKQQPLAKKGEYVPPLFKGPESVQQKTLPSKAEPALAAAGPALLAKTLPTKVEASREGMTNVLSAPKTMAVNPGQHIAEGNEGKLTLVVKSEKGVLKAENDRKEDFRNANGGGAQKNSVLVNAAESRIEPIKSVQANTERPITSVEKKEARNFDSRLAGQQLAGQQKEGSETLRGGVGVEIVTKTPDPLTAQLPQQAKVTIAEKGPADSQRQTTALHVQNIEKNLKHEPTKIYLDRASISQPSLQSVTSSASLSPSTPAASISPVASSVAASLSATSSTSAETVASSAAASPSATSSTSAETVASSAAASPSATSSTSAETVASSVAASLSATSLTSAEAVASLVAASPSATSSTSAETVASSVAASPSATSLTSAEAVASSVAASPSATSSTSAETVASSAAASPSATSSTSAETVASSATSSVSVAVDSEASQQSSEHILHPSNHSTQGEVKSASGADSVLSINDDVAKKNAFAQAASALCQGCTKGGACGSCGVASASVEGKGPLAGVATGASAQKIVIDQDSTTVADRMQRLRNFTPPRQSAEQADPKAHVAQPEPKQTGEAAAVETKNGVDMATLNRIRSFRPEPASADNASSAQHAQADESGGAGNGAADVLKNLKANGKSACSQGCGACSVGCKKPAPTATHSPEQRLDMR